jgi:hypothetical protein
MVVFMAKKEKKVDVKAVEKAKVMAVVEQALRDAGYALADGAEYGFAKGVMVVQTEVTDVQLKPIVPKAGVTRYAKIEEAEEETEVTE